jgi:hypothetical protein
VYTITSTCKEDKKVDAKSRTCLSAVALSIHLKFGQIGFLSYLTPLGDSFVESLEGRFMYESY